VNGSPNGKHSLNNLETMAVTNFHTKKNAFHSKALKFTVLFIFTGDFRKPKKVSFF